MLDGVVQCKHKFMLQKIMTLELWKNDLLVRKLLKVNEYTIMSTTLMEALRDLELDQLFLETHQVEGIDCNEVFASIMKMVTI